MEFRDLVLRRRMVRTYDPSVPVARETVDELLRLAVRAPSAGFTQGWHFLVLDEPESRTAFWAATAQGGDAAQDPWLRRMQTAPVLIVCLSDKDAYFTRYAEPDKGSVPPAEQDWPIPYWYVDTAMAAVILLLAATDRGLGALFFGVPGAAWPALRQRFGIPARLDPVGVVSIGTAAPDKRSPSLRRGRRPFEQVVSYGSFGPTGRGPGAHAE